jgi:hypothetical protein
VNVPTGEPGRVRHDRQKSVSRPTLTNPAAGIPTPSHDTPHPRPRPPRPPTGWSAGHAPDPKRVAADPSFECSPDRHVPRPQPRHGDRPSRTRAVRGPRASPQARARRPLLRVLARSPRRRPHTRPRDPRGWPPLATHTPARSRSSRNKQSPRSLTRAPSRRQRPAPSTTNPDDPRDREPCSPTTPPSHTPPPTHTANDSAEIRLRGARHTSSYTGWTLLLLTTPARRHRPPRARFQLHTDAQLPHPRAAQPNLNRPDSTPIRTEYKRPNRPPSSTPTPPFALTRPPAPGAQTQPAQKPAPVSSTQHRTRPARP